MASKKQTFEQAMEIINKYDVPDELRTALTNLLAPKNGGKTLNIEEVTKVNEEGDVIAILDSVTGLWLPADEETFYVDKSGKGIPVGDIFLKRTSKLGYSIVSKHKKAMAASKEAIFNDVLSGDITPDEGSALVEELEASTPDFSELEEMVVA